MESRIESRPPSLSKVTFESDVLVITVVMVA